MPRIGSDIETASISPPQRATSYCLWQDGDHWGCIRGDFESIEGSILGVGETPCEAVENLLEELARVERSGE